MKTFIMVFAIVLAQSPSQIRQAQTGVMTGQLLSPSGNPAAGVRVSAMSAPNPKDPTGGGVLVSLAETDSAGKFRLENIPPGDYYIHAGLLDAPNYYPGVDSIQAAKAVSIAAGAVVENLDFKVTRSPGVRVSGRVPKNLIPQPRMAVLQGTGDGGVFRVGGGVSVPGNRALVFGNSGTPLPVIIAAGASGIPGYIQPVTIDANGAFEFLRVKPGNYTLVLTPGNTQMRLTFDVKDKDIELNFLPASPGVKVSGVVEPPRGAPRPANQRLVLDGTSVWHQAETTVDASGRFELTNVPAGTYTARTFPGPQLSGPTITVGNQDITDLVLRSPLELDVVVTVQEARDGAAAARGVLPGAMTISAASSDGATYTAHIGQGALTVYVDDTGRNMVKLRLVEGEYRVSVNVTPVFSVRSLTYGSTDLLMETLKLDRSSALSKIYLTLVKEP